MRDVQVTIDSDTLPKPKVPNYPLLAAYSTTHDLAPVLQQGADTMAVYTCPPPVLAINLPATMITAASFCERLVQWCRA